MFIQSRKISENNAAVKDTIHKDTIICVIMGLVKQ